MAQHDRDQPASTELVPQADPQLGLSEGRAGPTQIVIASIAALAVIALLFYGLSNQRDANTVSTDVQTTQAAAPPAQPRSPLTHQQPPARACRRPTKDSRSSGLDQSILAPEAFTTFAHFGISDFT
jgi:hypothetical protein